MSSVAISISEREALAKIETDPTDAKSNFVVGNP